MMKEDIKHTIMIHDIVKDIASDIIKENKSKVGIYMPKSTGIIKWFIAQKDYAKFAWTVIVIVGALLGYQISVVKNPEGIKPSVAAQTAIEKNMPEVRSQSVIDSAKNIHSGLKRVSETVLTN